MKQAQVIRNHERGNQAAIRPLRRANPVGVANHTLLRVPGRGILQSKLAIGKPNDAYEQEADRVAERIMRIPDSQSRLMRSTTPSLQRQTPKASEPESNGIRFEKWPPELKLRLKPFVLNAGAKDLSIDYRVKNSLLSVAYDSGPSLKLDSGGYKTSFGYNADEKKYSLKVGHGEYRGEFSSIPDQHAVGLKLGYGAKAIQSDSEISKNVMTGWGGASNIANTLPAALHNPLGYSTAHKQDIKDISKTAELIKNITEDGKKHLRWGAEFGITWDPKAKTVVSFTLRAQF